MKFLIATKNKHKLLEVQRILEPMGITAISENELDICLSDVVEDGDSFEENALIKARRACKETGMITVADDSGLCVDALNGAPGIYSARYAGEPSDSDKNNQKLLKALENVPYEKRTAAFVSVIACVFPDGREFCVQGSCKGFIGFSPMGEGGFGYDPLFISKLGCFGEISAEQKDSISHRGEALKIFSKELKNYI